jgi:hypothetical protein
MRKTSKTKKVTKASKTKKDAKKSLRNTNERKRSKKVISRKTNKKVRSRKISRKRSRKVRKSFGMENGDQEPDICALIPSHINNKKKFTDILDVVGGAEDTNGKVFTDEKKGKSFLLGKELAKGANGYIFEGTFNGMDIVIKSIPINTKNLENNMLEMVVQSHLACGHNSELEQDDSALIPKIYFIAKSKKNYFIGSEKLNGNLHDFIRSRTDKETKSKIVKELVFKIARTLLLLQKKCNFIHGDLHLGNIMYKGDIKDPENLKWYIIDFGMSAINIKDNETKSDNIIVLSKYLKSYKGDAKIFDYYDLRILFLSLADNVYIDKYNTIPRFDEDFLRWLAVYLISPATYLSFQEVLFHSGYEFNERVSEKYLSPYFILNKPTTDIPVVKLLESKQGCNIKDSDYLYNLLENVLTISSFIYCSEDEEEDENEEEDEDY